MSRKLSDLLPVVRQKAQALLVRCQQAGIELSITQTLRSWAEQDALFKQGRTTPGKVVTKAKGGESWHNFGRAFDVVPLKGGQPWWDAPIKLWTQIGEIGESCGLEWGGRWTGLIDLPHFEDTSGMTLAQARAKHDAYIGNPDDGGNAAG